MAAYLNWTEISLIALLLALLIWIIITHGVSGRFIYVDKRKPNVTLHLAIFGTPRNNKGVHKVATSLENCLQHLKAKGYVSATLESHLIDQKKIRSFYRIAKKYGYSIQDVSYFSTPYWQRFFIPFSMATCRFKMKIANPTSCKLTIFF